MRVTLCVDALQPQLSGIGRYTWELCNRLPAQEEISRLLFYRDEHIVAQPDRFLVEANTREIGRSGPRWLQRLRTKRALRTSVVHGPNYFLPAQADTGVITVHDLSVFRYPETHPRPRIEAFERLFQSSLKRASHVITDTETVRRELIDTLSLSRKIVSAIPLGVEPSYRARAPDEVAPQLRKWGLEPGRYGLSVAAFEPRKKTAELLLAWRRLPRGVRDRFPLVLAGAQGWRNEVLHEKIAEAQSEGWLKHLGYVDEGTLPLLYSGARVFIYPSIYEGFGLPPVEAMASGTPVIVANCSCLPEVCGDAAGYIDPDDSDAFTNAIHHALLDEQWQLEAVRRGLRRAGLYSWDRCVEDTVTVYKKVSV